LISYFDVVEMDVVTSFFFVKGCSNFQIKDFLSPI